MARSGICFFDCTYSAAWINTIFPSMSDVRDNGVFPEPLAGGSSPRSTNFPERISSTRECFRAGTPGATTTVSEALELLPPPVGRGRLASSNTAEKLVSDPRWGSG